MITYNKDSVNEKFYLVSIMNDKYIQKNLFIFAKKLTIIALIDLKEGDLYPKPIYFATSVAVMSLIEKSLWAGC